MTAILGLTAFGLLCLFGLAFCHAAATGDLMAENMSLAAANDTLAAALVESQEEAQQNAAAARCALASTTILLAQRDSARAERDRHVRTITLLLDEIDRSALVAGGAR